MVDQKHSFYIEIGRFKIEKPKDKFSHHTLGPKLANHERNILQFHCLKSFLTWHQCIVGFSRLKQLAKKSFLCCVVEIIHSYLKYHLFHVSYISTNNQRSLYISFLHYSIPSSPLSFHYLNTNYSAYHSPHQPLCMFISWMTVTDAYVCILNFDCEISKRKERWRSR